MEKAPYQNSETFTNIDSLLYKHAMGGSEKFLALVIHKSWHFTVFIKAHDKLGHQVVQQDLPPYQMTVLLEWNE